MNLHGGVNLNKVHRWTLDFPDPPEGYGTAFMSRQGIDALKTRVKDDPAYYQWLYGNDTYTRPLFDAWRDPGREKLAACLDQIFQQSHDMLESLVNRGGIYDFSIHYWHGGLAAQRYGVWIDQLLGDPRLTADERARLKAAAVMFANVVWDDDHAPISSMDHGLNLGTENMPIQQWGYRRFYALFLARHPTMAERARQVEGQLRATVEDVIHDSGAEIGCTHYIGASFVPTLNTLLQVKQLGKTDPFKQWPKLAKFAEFYLNLQTPPEPRMGGKPALVPFGDSGLETSETFGLLGTGFRDADPALSQAADGRVGGRRQAAFVLLWHDHGDDRRHPRRSVSPRPTSPPTALGRRHIPRLLQRAPPRREYARRDGPVLRQRRLLPRPSPLRPRLDRAVCTWQAVLGRLVGDLHAPSPRRLCPFDGASGSRDRPRLGQGRRAPDAAARSGTTRRRRRFNRLPIGRTPAKFRGDKLDWTRAVTVVRATPSQPIIVIRDRFTGENAGVPKVSSLNLMAVGPVATPAGPIEPPQRTHPVRRSKGRTRGVAFRDQADRSAPRHRRVSFHRPLRRRLRRLSIGTEPRQALLGNWADTAWGGAVTEREERQHILRVRGSGPFTTVIVPWRRDAKPQRLTVAADGDTVVVTTSTGTTRIAADGFTVEPVPASLAPVGR